MMPEKQSINDFRSLYNYLSGTYDERQSNPTTERIREVEKGLLKQYAKGKILDAGCGTGYYFGDKDYVGIDLSEGMLGQARKKSSRICQGRAEEMPFKDCSFDTVISMLATLNFCPLAQSAREISRALKGGGRAIFSAASIYDNGYTVFEKLKQKGGIREKTTRIQKRGFRMRLFPKEEVIEEFSKNGMRLIFFDSVFRVVNPEWGNFSSFPLKDRVLLALETILPLRDYGCVYFFVFEKAE